MTTTTPPTMTFEEAYRNVFNLTSQFASLVALLPTLEKARDAEKFLADSKPDTEAALLRLDQLSTKRDNLLHLISQAESTLSGLKNDAVNAKAALQSISSQQAKALRAMENEIAERRGVLDAEIQSKVTQKEKAQEELDAVKRALQTAQATQRSLSQQIEKANAALGH